MSNLRLNSGKSEVTSSTIGFRFHTNDEELEEVKSKGANSEVKNTDANDGFKVKAVSITSDFDAKVVDDNDVVPDAVKDHWNLLGRKSSSTDSSFESPFSNPIETWKRLNVLKEKIAKTVEEKISEMKIDRNVLSKSNQNKLVCSKENSSVSDSEDTSESSKISEQLRAEENQVSDSLVNESSDTCSNLLDTPEVEEEKHMKGSENELRNRKVLTGFSELLHLPDIKVATAKSELDGSLLDDSLAEEVESGVEAAEHLETTDTESVEAFDGSVARSSGGSENPPGGVFFGTFAYLNSFITPYSHIIALFLSIILYFMFPLSDFIRGFLLSFVLAISWGIIKTYLRFDDVTQQKSFIMPDYKSMPPLKVPQYKSPKGVWVNEYEKEIYDPDYYSVSETVPAYLELDKNILKLSRPKGRICKRATFDEPEYKLQFIGQRTYNISGCNVYLMPDGLTKKRLFSKKYPIVIFLKPDSLISEKKNAKEMEEKNEKGETEEVAYTASETSRTRTTLHLFARCDRQKQEWYQKLLTATRLPVSPVSTKNGKIAEGSEEKENCDDTPSKESSTPFEHLFFDDEVILLEEYLRYMTKFLKIEMIRQEVKVRSRSSWYRKLRTRKRDALKQEDVDPLSMKNVSVNFINKRTKASSTSNDEGDVSEKLEEKSPSSLQIQWFNAFVNRILFDVFRSPYWLNKIHDKLQRKLNSIRLPYYIEDIEVIEMDLGKNGPIFHRVSQPAIDELGLWFDMDTTFNGLIRLTIQTHLNLVKLQKGMEENESAQIQEKLKKEKKKAKEARDSSFDKESKEKFSENVSPKNKKWSKSDDAVSSHENNNPEEHLLNQENSEHECKSCEDCRNKLIDELAQLTEIVIEESLAENKKLKSESKPATNGSCKTRCERLRSAIYDSELEDSAESSDEEEEEEKHPPPPQDTEEQTSMPISKRYPRDRKSSKRIFKMFENVAQSKYFRSMAQSKYVQKAIAGVSAAKLKLTVEIKSCTGTLVVNVPPPPNDRFWYGFREMPKLVFSANPKIGDKTVRFAHIRNYLQKKILHELKKVMVVPNMIDFVLPTSVQTQGSNSPQFEDSDLPEVTTKE